jgi:hypothetical protein
MEDSFLADIQSTTYFKLCSLDTDSQFTAQWNRKVTVFHWTLWTVHFWDEFKIELHQQHVSHICCQDRIVELEFMLLHYQR